MGLTLYIQHHGSRTKLEYSEQLPLEDLNSLWWYPTGRGQLYEQWCKAISCSISQYNKKPSYYMRTNVYATVYDAPDGK